MTITGTIDGVYKARQQLIVSIEWGVRQRVIIKLAIKKKIKGEKKRRWIFHTQWDFVRFLFTMFFCVVNLQGNLPVALIFDQPDNSMDTSNITNLSTKYGVFITVRQKSRQSTTCIVLKGVEKFVGKLKYR